LRKKKKKFIRNKLTKEELRAVGKGYWENRLEESELTEGVVSFVFNFMIKNEYYFADDRMADAERYKKELEEKYPELVELKKELKL